MYSKKVGKSSVYGRVYSSGVARVTIPFEVDRDVFVKECLRTGFISIQPQEGSILNRCLCDRDVLQQLSFPASANEETGSLVVYVNLPKFKVPVIIAIIDNFDEYNDLKENQFKILRSSQNGSVAVSGDGDGNLLITTNSNKSKKGSFDINISNVDSTAKMNVNVKGEVDLVASGKVNINSNSELELAFKNVNDEAKNSSLILNESKQVLSVNDTTVTIEDGEIDINSNSIKHNLGSEPMVLGTTLKELLDDFIDQVAAITTTTAIGTQPILNKIQVTALKERTSNILSSKSKLD